MLVSSREVGPGLMLGEKINLNDGDMILLCYM